MGSVINRWVYDIETVINCFTLTAIQSETEEVRVFEVSDRCNDLDALRTWLWALRDSGAELVGFNSLSFDWPVCQWLLLNPHRATSAGAIYRRAQEVIESEFPQIKKPAIPQIDLYRIAHFNNVARRTSLKRLTFNMRGPNIQEMEHPHSEPIAPEHIDELLAYNLNDVRETLRFYRLPAMQGAIQFRQQLGADYLNLPDAGLGKRTVEQELQRAGIQTRAQYGPLQTVRDQIALGDIILPQIQFTDAEFARVLNSFRCTVVDAQALSFKESAVVGGVRYDFGLGGIHGSVSRQRVVADNGRIIVDLDVASMYPSIALVNRFYPEHLGEKFCDVYQDIYSRRLEAKANKNKLLDAMLKLALNAVYGDSNNPYSFLYDTRYTLSITVNGQLLLAMLVEWLREIDGLEVIQANTDGVTVTLPANLEPLLMEVGQRWEWMSGLKLERADYRAMFIRDVNNYAVVKLDGSMKLKGAYELEPELHKDHSNIISRRAAIEYMVNGTPVEETITGCQDLYDFAILARCDRPFIFEIDGKAQQRNLRYYVSQGGDKLIKRSPALGPIGAFKLKRGVTEHPADPYTWSEDHHTKSKTQYEERLSEVEAGRTIRVINRMPATMPADIDYEYYIERAQRLII